MRLYESSVIGRLKVLVSVNLDCLMEHGICAWLAIMDVNLTDKQASSFCYVSVIERIVIIMCAEIQI